MRGITSLGFPKQSREQGQVLRWIRAGITERKTVAPKQIRTQDGAICRNMLRALWKVKLLHSRTIISKNNRTNIQYTQNGDLLAGEDYLRKGALIKSKKADTKTE